MNPGELNCRVILQKANKVPDGQGGYMMTHTPHAAVWAKITAVTTKTVDQYEQMTPEILQRIVIRYRSNVLVTDRIEYGSRIFEQLGPPINEGEKNAFLRLECREVVGDAASD